jgi:hypothetical protein
MRWTLHVAHVGNSGGPGFKYQSGYRLSRLRFFVVSLIPPGECWDSTRKLGHDRFLPNPFQFIFHISPFLSTLYSLQYWKKSLNKVKQIQINVLENYKYIEILAENLNRRERERERGVDARRRW